MSFLACGDFWRRNRETICPRIVKSVNKSVYVNLPDNHLPTVLKCVNDTLGDISFQQENAPVHKEGLVKDSFQKYNIDADDWPLCYTHLNPIEHIWLELKRKLYGK
jgi:hypothetical protein